MGTPQDPPYPFPGPPIPVPDPDAASDPDGDDPKPDPRPSFAARDSRLDPQPGDEDQSMFLVSSAPDLAQKLQIAMRAALGQIRQS
jgi:hypothetical protein